MSADDARILDRGYRRFEGTRVGVSGAVRSVAWHTARSILGLGRKGRHKVFPVIVVVVAFLPALGFLALAVLIGDLLEGELRPDYWEFFGFSLTAALLFTALVAPEAVVRDRRDGMFSLYLSTPLTRPTYLTAKVIAVMGVMSIIVLGPPLLWLFGYTFQSQGPDGIGTWFGVLGRLLVAGLAIGLVYTAVSLGAASLTDRRAFASVAVILVLFGTSIVVGLLIEVAGLGPNYRLLSPVDLPAEIAPRLFGERSPDFAAISTLLVVAGNVAWFVAGSAVVAWRYRKLEAV